MTNNDLIIFQDDNIVIANKPSGIPSQATIDKTRNSFDRMISLAINAKVQPAHRIDKDTSGLIIYCKTTEGLKYFNNLFQSRNIQKSYLVISSNCLPETQGTMKDYVEIRKDKNINKLFKVKSGGKNASLNYELLTSRDVLNLYRVTLETGRMHQIRAQFFFRNCPLVNDVLYGDIKNVFIDQLGLHSYELRFINLDGKELTIRAPVPKSFKSFFDHYFVEQT